jgi:hypothetical protein
MKNVAVTVSESARKARITASDEHKQSGARS